MHTELEKLDRICEILWEEKENWKNEIENYLMNLSVTFEKFIQLINIGEVTNYTAGEVLDQIQRLMVGLQHRDNMYIADVLIGETRQILMDIYKEDE